MAVRPSPCLIKSLNAISFLPTRKNWPMFVSVFFFFFCHLFYFFSFRFVLLFIAALRSTLCDNSGKRQDGRVAKKERNRTKPNKNRIRLLGYIGHFRMGTVVRLQLQGPILKL